jgi:anaerobic dimethyl sulfoxide reductase subunit B (iron-sulfur subunit)
MACNQEYGFAPGVSGLKVMEFGPFNIAADNWQYDFFVVPTDWCSSCAARRKKGKLPSCVLHCQSQCIEVDELENLTAKIANSKQMLFVIR